MNNELTSCDACALRLDPSKQEANSFNLESDVITAGERVVEEAELRFHYGAVKRRALKVVLRKGC